MAFAMPISYSRMTLQQIIGSKGFVNSFAQNVIVPDGPHCGNVTCTVISSATPATIVESTMVSNLAVTVATALTFVDTQLTISLMPSQSKSFFTKPENLVTLAKNHADGFVYAATGAMIADMYAATPGLSVTLPDGQGNMKTDGTAAEGHENMSKLLSLIAYCMSHQQAASAEEFGIIMYQDTFANTITLRSDSYKAIYDSTNNIWRFLGIPIYVTSYATNFGAASRPAAFVYHRDAGAIVWDEPEIMGGGPMWHNDAMIKWTTICPYGHALHNTALLGELLNLAAL
jgi:hypothetical protein